MTLEDARDSIATILTKEIADDTSWCIHVQAIEEMGGPSRALAGRIGRHFLKSLNEALRAHGVRVTRYTNGVFCIARAEGRTP